MISNPMTLVSVFVVFLILVFVIISYFFKRKLDKKIRALEITRQELQKHVELLDMANETSQSGAWETFPKEGTIFVSEQWFRMLGYNIKGGKTNITNHLNYVHPHDRHIVIDFFERYIRGLEKGDFEREIRLRLKDDTYCWVLSKAKAVAWDKDGMVVRIIGLDMNIQSLKSARIDLEKSEIKFRTMFEHAPYPVSITNFDNRRFMDANKAFFDFHGISRKELTGFSILDLSTIDKDKDQTIIKEIEKKGFIKNHETEIIGKKDGKKRNILFSSVLLDIEGLKQILSITLDITDRKMAEKEREKFQERLHRSQKLEAVGILAGGVAHDFNNMLSAIIGYTELTLDQMDPGDPLKKNLDEIMNSAQRSANLVRQLLAFARKQTIEPRLFDINKSIEKIYKMIRRLIGENIDLAWIPGEGPLKVSMDPSHFDQIMVNLCVNARDAINDVGKITIETERITVGEDDMIAQPDMARGDYVQLSISDNGIGMDKETLSHIFDPFFTTKEMGRGTGMGLSTVYGIIKQYNGVISVYSEPQEGTSFKIFMPLDTTAEEDEKPQPVEEIHRSRGETVLIIEDEPALLELSHLMLQRLEYNVLPAATPGEAINIAEQTDIDIHLMITDVIMPEMNGKKLADRIQRIRPDIKVLFMSGYTADVIGHQGVLEKGVHFIQKPFTMRDLGYRIRNALD